MPEWRTVTVEEIAAPGKNSLATGPFGSAISARFFVGSGIPVIRGSNLSLDVGNRLTEADLAFIPDELAAKFGRSCARAGDLVFTCWGTVGQVGLIDSRASYDEYIVSNKQMKLTPDTKLTSPLFLYYVFSNPQFVKYLQSIAIGSSVPGFNLGQLRKVAFMLPPLVEQQAIAAVLGALDDKIVVNDRSASTAHALAQALSSSAHKAAKLTKLSEIANITMGSSPPGESYNEDGIGMPFYQGTRDFGDRFPRLRVWCSSPVRAASEGSCLISVRAPVGRVNFAREPCCIGRGLAAVQSKLETPSVLFHELAATSDVWAPFESEGTVFGAINKQELANIEIPALDTDSARALENILMPLDHLVASASDENHALEELRDTILPKLVSGEIRVRDAERAVEDVT